MRTLDTVENEIKSLIAEENVIMNSKFISWDKKVKIIISMDTALMRLYREAERFHWQEIKKLREKKWTNQNIVSGDKYIRDDIAED